MAVCVLEAAARDLDPPENVAPFWGREGLRQQGIREGSFQDDERQAELSWCDSCGGTERFVESPN